MYEKESHLDACCHPKKSFAPGELITISTYPVNGKYTITAHGDGSCEHF